MTFLFDVSPEEIPDASKSAPSRKRRQPSAGVQQSAEAADGGKKEAEAAIFLPQRRRNDTIIGRSAGHYQCGYEGCGSAYFDILDEWRGEWFVECMVCGTGQYVPAVSGVLQTPDNAGEFVFADGRYEGLSMAEVAADKNGPTYIAWAAENHKREAVRIACKKWIDATGPRP